MSHSRGERGERGFDVRQRVLRTAEARVEDLGAALDALKSVRHVLQRSDLDELEVVRLALERTQHEIEHLEPRLERAITGRGAEYRRTKEGSRCVST